MGDDIMMGDDILIPSKYIPLAGILGGVCCLLIACLVTFVCAHKNKKELEKRNKKFEQYRNAMRVTAVQGKFNNFEPSSRKRDVKKWKQASKASSYKSSTLVPKVPKKSRQENESILKKLKRKRKQRTKMMLDTDRTGLAVYNIAMF